MPSIKCECGHRICYGDIPCSDEWLMMSDTAFDKHHGQVDVDELYRAMTHVLKCPDCGWLWVYWNGFRNDPQGYRPE
ncbi:hypothetical protein LMG28138_01700 [Pararobbsia alpina]|uniref:Uncharacterized protein n=1 Tax=Pararobbsia alpina TaxID=621374 RepID=A0A6S7B9R1_9BURK|nr:hypothetical protein LMG28138_01700 [Pararobbsia alpina]